MRTDLRSDLLRRVDDHSPWYDQALFHAITALEDIADGNHSFHRPVGHICRSALDQIEVSLGAAPPRKDQG